MLGLTSPTQVLVEQGSAGSSAHATPAPQTSHAISPPHPGQLPQLAGDLLEQRKGPVLQARHPKGQLRHPASPKHVAFD